MQSESRPRQACIYCGAEFEQDSQEFAFHMHANTEVVAELPAILGRASGVGSIDVHEGKLYAVTVRPGECCSDDVSAKPVTRDSARLMIESEIQYHEHMASVLSSGRESILARIESAEEAPPRPMRVTFRDRD